jgi:dephospho-CoA kinase
MTVIALTGGIASGKSTAAGFFGEKGAYVIDADLLGHKAYEPGQEAWRKVIAAFGDDIVAPDQTIDRKILGGKVFGKPENLTRLTDIVWPEIRSLAEAEIGQAQSVDADRPVVLEAAVLFEAGWDDIGDEVWVVIVEPSVAIERAVARDGVSPEQIQSRIDSQLSNDERRVRASRVIDNSGDKAAFTAELETAWAALTSG